MSYPKKPKGRLLTIIGIRPDEIGYNPAVIPQRGINQIATGQPIIAVRIENVKSSWLDPDTYHPRIMFFKRSGNCLHPLTNTPIFYQYEDPWATWIKSGDKVPQLLFGAVKFDSKNHLVSTHLFIAENVRGLNKTNPVAIIKGMRDIRVTQIKNGQLAVFTRPTQGQAHPGRIGFTLINTVEEIETAVTKAPLLKFNLNIHTKIGANEAWTQTITNSSGIIQESIHVFCHLGTTDPTRQNDRLVHDFEHDPIHYSGYEFNLDPQNPFAKPLTLRKIADRRDFPKNTLLSKNILYKDVIFPGGTGGSDFSEYYAGVEDARVGVLDLATLPSKPT